MVTLKGKQADKFIKKMIKKEKSPISKREKKLAREIEDTMAKLQIIENDKKIADLKRKELEDKYNPTIPMAPPGICVRCKKNKATINYTKSMLDYAHGFVEHICRDCYNKEKEANPWYKEGYKKGWNDCLKALG